MFEYPLTNISKQLWHKKVEATLMFSIPAQDEALPYLYEILDVLQHLNGSSLQEVLGEDVRQYFMNEVFPQVCGKIIKSRYFKNDIVLTLSNKILSNSLQLYPRYLHLLDKYRGLNQILATILASDEYYFKTNNQLDYKLYPHYYFDALSNYQWTSTLKQEDLVDVIKSNGKYDKLIWSRGKVLAVNESYIEVEYLSDVHEKTINVDRHSFEIAPYQSRSKDFDWRMGLKEGDIIDCQDSFGGWYHGTVLKTHAYQNGAKTITVTFKVYDQNGNKSDEKGKFYGFTDQEETFDATVPRIMPFCSTCKYRNYQVAKSSFQTDDSNDMVFEQIDGEKIYALPRKRQLSEFYFKELNTFGRMGGFDKAIEKMQTGINFQFLCSYVKAMGNVCAYLHKQVVILLVQNVKTAVEKHLFAQSDIVTKEFTKQRSQALFSGLKSLMKRLYSNDEVQQFENTLKMKLVSQCLESDTLKRKLQGLHELKDIVRGISHISERAKTVKAWIIQQKIFDKIYLQNSHVQLIKKSQDFFKFLINEDILQVKDLQRLYKIAQKGDYQSRVSLYKLFQEMSHVFNKSHVDFLIDTILESDLNLVLNEDIDMLHELSRFSNYFPKEKVKDFFEKLILNETKNKELNQYAIKKYSEIVARGYEMKAYRREIIKNFIAKLNTSDYEKVIKVLKGIFDGINVGEWGRKDLSDILQDQKVQQLIVTSIKQNKDKADYKKMVNQMLNFQLFIVKLNSKIRIPLQTVRRIWEQLKTDESKKNDYYHWLNRIMECEQGIEVDQEKSQEELVEFYRELFTRESLQNLTNQQFTLARNLFVEINKKAKLLAVASVIKQKQMDKQYTRKTDMKSLKLLSQIETIIFHCTNTQIAQKAFHFYLGLYSSKENSKQETSEMLQSLISKLKTVYEQKDYAKIERTLNMLEMVVNDSEKFQELEVASMIKCRKSGIVNVTFINDVSYAGDSIRKQNIFERSNISILHLKKLIAPKVGLGLQELKVVGRVELTDYYNSYTLAELNINCDDPLTVSRKFAPSIPEENLIIDGKLNPKAIRVFKIVFDKYSSRPNEMSKDDYNRFTGMCLNTYSKSYYDKIHPIYNKYDSNHDGCLSFQDFITFYTDAALEKPSTVWSNLKNLHVRGNFKFKDEPEEVLAQEELPRYKLYNNEQIYDMLFNLLEEKSISKTVYKFLLRLPANKTMHQGVINIWDSTQQKGRQQLKTFLTQKSKFRLMYKLILILNIIHHKDSACMWNIRYAMKRGYEVPFEFLVQIADSKEQYKGIDLDIIELIFELIKDYVYNSFGDKEALQSSSLFEEDCTMDEKMECLVIGVYPKSLSMVKRDFSIAFRYHWEVTKLQITKFFLSMLCKMKTQITTQKQPQKKTVLSSMIFKLMGVLSCLLVNENQQDLLPLYPLFFDERQSPKDLNQFYIMILCICYYSHTSQQHLHIHELFKYIKTKHITSEHFRILALLVSKFGFKEENMSEIPQVLLRNILEQENQPTIEGCAKLLCNFQVSQLSSITPKDVQNIFDKCLFGQNITCKKQAARNQIYQLLIKISEANKEIAEKVVEKTKSVILENMPLMKVTYSTQVNKRSTYNYAGLKNLGNICYMNSMIQQLYVNKTFRYLLVRANDKKDPEWTFDAKGQQVDDNFLHQIQRIFAYLEKSTRQEFSPSAFCIAYKPFGESVNIMMQQDVQEFVSMFFDRLQEGIKEHPLRNLVQNFYTGKTANLFKCHNCKKAKKIEENFHSVSLEVKNSKSLSQSFNRYALGEVINDYKCDFCGQKVDVSKMSRISKPPQVLIIHLQRIVFNLDTFINEKITTKHEFPIQLNIYPYTLQHFDRQESSQQHPQDLSQFDYQLTGIIIHIGNAESGHYISYIKTEDNRWLQFNDSLVSLFSVNSIEAECFGGMSMAFEDDFDWEKKESSKSAYLLIYNRKVDPKIQLVLRQAELVKTAQILDLLKVQVQQQKPQVMDTSTQKISEPTESQQQTGSAFEDSQQQREKRKYREQQEIKELQMIKKKKSDDNIQSKPDFVVQKQINKSETITLKIKNTITPYIAPQLSHQITIDNRVHFFQTSLASEGFSTFFAKLISIPHLHSEELIKMCQKLTFNFWLKSKSFKQLLQALEVYLKTHPQSVYELVLKNELVFGLLIQNSNYEIRHNVAHFLANSIEAYALTGESEGGRFLKEQSEVGKNIYTFLDKMFELIPTTVTKCWTKFNNYFEFWYLVSQKIPFAQYLVKKQVLKHLVDYFLDKKSPLKIYTIKKVQQIGSSYANPDFQMLLKCVSTLLGYYFDQKYGFELNEEDKKVLIYFEFLEKLISEGYQEIAAKMARQVCPNNVKASEKFAIVLLKGFSKSTYENIHKYIEVLREFVTIEDEFQQARMEWVLGKETLMVSTVTKALSASSSKNLDQRLNSFQSSLQIQNGASFLDPIFHLNRRVQNFCILCVQGLIQICLTCKPVRTYMFGMNGPNYLFGKYLDFFEEFINRYIDESKRAYYSTVTTFDKTGLGLEVKELYVKLMEIKKEEYQQDLNQGEESGEHKQEGTIEQATKHESEFKFQQQQTAQQILQQKNHPTQQDHQVIEFDFPQLKINSSQDSQRIQFLNDSFSKGDNNDNSNNKKEAGESEYGSSGVDMMSRNNSEEPPILINTVSNDMSENSQGQSSGGYNYQYSCSYPPLNQTYPQQQPIITQNTNAPKLMKCRLDSTTLPEFQQGFEEQKVGSPVNYPANTYEQEIWQTDYITDPSLNPYYAVDGNFDNDSHKNNSRKSQVEHNDSRDDDFGGIEMKEMGGEDRQKKCAQEEGKGEVQDILVDQYNPNYNNSNNNNNNDSDQELINAINSNDKKSSDWSNDQLQNDPYPLGAHAGAVPRAGRRRPALKNGLKIQSKNKLNDQEELSQVENSDVDEKEPFIKSKQKIQQSKGKEQQQGDHHTSRQPIQFIYKPIQTLQISKQLTGVQVIYHQSKLITILTKPTSTTNLAFTKGYSTRKLLDRVKEDVWPTRREHVVKGFYVSNYSRNCVRVNTAMGSQLIKSNESGWVWSDTIIKIWKCEKSFQWPDWQLNE